MLIVGVKVLEFRRRLDGLSWNPAFRWDERRAPLLVIETDAGLSGVGEGWSRQSQVPSVLERLAGYWAPRLLGADAQDAASLSRLGLQDVPDGWVAAAAASAVDMALWDLHARAAGVPLWAQLGGRSGRVAVYASGGLYRDGSTTQDLAREFGHYARTGFTAMKMKVGALSLDADIERARSVRGAIGSEHVLWVDAVNQLSHKDAPAWCAALAQAGAAAIQAPLPFDEIAHLADVNSRMLPVIADETEYREAAFRALLDAGAVSCLQFCLGLCGGYTRATRIDDEATSRGVTSTPQCFSTAIMQAASLHFGAARSNVLSVEFHRFHDHLAEALPAAMKRVESGHVTLDDTPGLGVAPPSIGEQPGGGDVRLHRHVTHQR